MKIKNSIILHILQIFTFLSFVLTCSGQIETPFDKAIRYKTKAFDVAIFPKNHNSFVGGNNFTPTTAEIDLAESALKTQLKKLNHNRENQYRSPVIHRHLRKYKRQYFGYLDATGNRILYINCFWSPSRKEIAHWLQELISHSDGASYYWDIKFNLDKGFLFDLEVNGQA